MDQYLENLDILFRRTNPKYILDNYIKKMNIHMLSADENEIHSKAYSQLAFKQYSHSPMSVLTGDEMRLRAEWLADRLKEYNKKGYGIFGFICDYASSMLRISGNEPVCDFGQIKRWNEAGRLLGQDLFVTAWLARQESKSFRNNFEKYDFAWSSILKTDNNVLNQLLAQGIAENHFHLKGSPQVFSITWVCLMNHPDRIEKILKSYKGFQYNLFQSIEWDLENHKMSWRERLAFAAIIRVLLFQRLFCKVDSETLDLHQRVMNYYINPRISYITDEIESMRQIFGYRFKQLNREERCLDYAISNLCYRVPVSHPFRILSGERSFLYSCFLSQFSGKFSEAESDLFYLYLLLKNSFRGELIQCNRVHGFDNFALYQDRKDRFYEGMKEYETEGMRTAIRGQMEENYIKLLEARIMPAVSPQKLEGKIKLQDSQVAFSYDLPNFDDVEEANQRKYFYVVHFPKSAFSQEEYQTEFFSLKPRNVKCRLDTKKKALALKDFLQKSDWSCRVYGIDACANEIGCRPETFATEFRYLRGEEHIAVPEEWDEKKKNERSLGVTYHVGEDFIDIVDGLRAIDEAVNFLGFRKGDRIGHGLVLGIKPGEYYQDRDKMVVIRKQDYLDNLLWLLDKSQELNLEMKQIMYRNIRKKARELFEYIYGIAISEFFPEDRGNLENYFLLYWHTWRLRGDHPSLYKTGKYSKERLVQMTEYEYYMEMPDESLSIYRQNPKITLMLFLYHFEASVKNRGFEKEYVNIQKEYIDFLEKFQILFRNQIIGKGIAIECNLTSNVLIGTFHDYEKHPIFIFKPIDEIERRKNLQIMVSVNTDDLGVFDTSLANEYALLYDVLLKFSAQNDNYDEKDIIDYIEELRKNGFRIAFKNL